MCPQQQHGVFGSRSLSALALAGVGVLVLAGCSGGGDSGGGSGENPTTFEFLKNAENTTTEPS